MTQWDLKVKMHLGFFSIFVERLTSVLVQVLEVEAEGSEGLPPRGHGASRLRGTRMRGRSGSLYFSVHTLCHSRPRLPKELVKGLNRQKLL